MKKSTKPKYFETKVVDEVFKLYSTGMPVQEIARNVGVSRNSIYRWRDKLGWEDRRATANKKAMEQVGETVSQIKQRQHLILKGIMNRFSEQLKVKDVKVSPNEMITALKHELHLFGEAEASIDTRKDITAEDLSRIYQEVYGTTKKTDKGTKS